MSTPKGDHYYGSLPTGMSRYHHLSQFQSRDVIQTGQDGFLATATRPKPYSQHFSSLERCDCASHYSCPWQKNDAVSPYDRYETQYNRYSQCLHQTHTSATSLGFIPDEVIEPRNLLQPSNALLPVNHAATRESLDGNIPIWSPTTSFRYPTYDGYPSRASSLHAYSMDNTHSPSSYGSDPSYVLVPYYTLPVGVRVISAESNMFAISIPLWYQSAPNTHQSSSMASRQDLLVNGMANPDAGGHKGSMRTSMAGSSLDMPRSPWQNGALENHTIYMPYHRYPPNEQATSAIRMRFELGNDVTLSTNHMVDRQRAMLSQLEELSGERRPLEELEMQVRRDLGMSEDFDSVEVLLRTRREVMHNGDYRLLEVLKNLNKLYHLRLNTSRIQSKLIKIFEPERYPLPSGPPHRVDASRFWAVLIGIDDYASYPLHGCVLDAKTMEKYLIEDLGVPKDRIQLLLGSKEEVSLDPTNNPSRVSIIRTLLSVIDNPQIKYGDNIIVYYAGHGSRYSFSEEDDEQAEMGFAEALCPIDRGTVDSNGIPVLDISDRELNTILTLISRAKGGRVTVFLDCCHSGGVTRDLPPPEARTAPRVDQTPLQDILLAGEKYLKYYPGYRSILENDWYPDMSSFVTLTACEDYQFAKAKRVEGGYIGLFTDSLVRTLRSGYLKEETTYADLVRALDKWPHQTPRAIGSRKDMRIWYED